LSGDLGVEKNHYPYVENRYQINFEGLLKSWNKKINSEGKKFKTSQLSGQTDLPTGFHS
jgi:hypothetical protein